MTLPRAAIHNPSENPDVVPVPSVDDDREVWYVAITDFSKGLGSTTRSRSICTALRIAGRRPRLLIPYAIGHGTNEQVTGVEDGLPYEYMNGSTTRPRGARRVVQAKVRASIQLAFRLWAARRRVSSVFLYNTSAFDAWPVLLAARVLRVPVVLDITDEWHDPSIPIRHLGFARYCFQLLSRASEGVMFRCVDRIIVVTRHFERRLQRHARKVVRLPMLFDPGRFENGPVERPAGAAGPSIVYAGSITTIEGVHILIESLARLTEGAAGRATLRIVGASAHGESGEDARVTLTTSLAVELGVPAFLVLVCLYGVIVRKVHRCTRSSHPVIRLYGAAVTPGLVLLLGTGVLAQFGSITSLAFSWSAMILAGAVVHVDRSAGRRSTI